MYLSNHWFILLIAVLLVAGCTNNSKQPDNSTAASINKIWVFEKIDTASHAKNLSTAWISENTLDMTNKDTLRLSYKNNKIAPSKYPYKINTGIIYIQNKASYKIIKLTDSQLYLASIFKKNVSVTIIYEAKP